MNDDLQHTINSRLPAWARRLVLSGLCGSHVHGTFIPSDQPHSTDDQDVFQIIAHPRSHYLGLGYYKHALDGYQTHGEALDIVVHELAKFVSLCAAGNPNVNTHLWLEPQEYFSRTDSGNVLLAHREVFVSKRMFPAFGGYAYGQLKKMTAGERLGYMGTKRKQLLEQYGYDIKNAAHCLRLFITGIALARTGTLPVKLTGQHLEWVLAVKRGEWSVGMVERYAQSLEQEFRAACKVSTLPDAPEADLVDRTLRRALEAHWDTLKDES